MKQDTLDELYRIDWKKLTHAYGYAVDTPNGIHRMVSANKQERTSGYNYFIGTLQHQGDYYDSTVAIVPILILLIQDSETCGREGILYLLKDLWLSTRHVGVDPWLAEPPGGVDLPTPMSNDEEAAQQRSQLEAAMEEQASGQEGHFDCSVLRRMDLCAWQAAKAVKRGVPVYQSLLQDSDTKVASAAANLLSLWPSTLEQAQIRLIQFINNETETKLQVERVLHLGVYESCVTADHYQTWCEPHHPLALRVAAALAWARLVEPDALPEEANAALQSATAADATVFTDLPDAGVLQGYLWELPTNVSWVKLSLLKNRNKDLRWRAAQSFSPERAKQDIPEAECVPALVELLKDPHGRIRNAALAALQARSETCMDYVPTLPSMLMEALSDDLQPYGDGHAGMDQGTSGHVARLLAKIAPRLSDQERELALEKLAGAKKEGHLMQMGRDVGMSTGTKSVVEEASKLIQTPKEWTVQEMLRQYDSSLEADRMLAEAYAASPTETIETAVSLIKPGPYGFAPSWLASLGAIAAAHLENLSPSGPTFTGRKSKLDSILEHVRNEDKLANMHKPQELETISDQSISQLDTLLSHPEACVRAAACDELASRVASGTQLPQVAIDSLAILLSDQAVSEFGIEGPFEYGGRHYQWRRECYSPCGSAASLLLAVDVEPSGPELFDAMLHATKSPKVFVFNGCILHLYSLSSWKSAARAAGGFEVVAPKLARAKAEAPYRTVSAELARVSARLSGRLL